MLKAVLPELHFAVMVLPKVCGQWVRCSCGRSFNFGSHDTKRKQLARCARQHGAVEDFVMRDSPVTKASNIFLILSHNGSHHLDRLLTKQLLENGVHESKIKVVYGYCIFGKP